MTPRGPGGRLLRSLRRRTPRPRRAAALRAQAREVYRDAILEAAERVFARSGFSGTRMAEVAAEAGLATGTLYNYFAGRDELLSSLVERRSEEMLAAVEQAATASRDAGLRELLVALLGTTFRQVEAHRELFAAVSASAGISGKHMAAIARQCLASQKSYQQVIGEALGRAAAAGQLRADLPIDILVGVFLGAAHGVMRAWMTQDPDVQPLVDQAPAVVDLYLRGASPPT